MSTDNAVLAAAICCSFPFGKARSSSLPFGPFLLFFNFLRAFCLRLGTLGTLGRYGGDEFGTDTTVVRHIAKMLLTP